MKIYRVKLANRTVVPPCSDKISVAEFDKTPDNDIVIQPTQFMKCLLILDMPRKKTSRHYAATST